MQVEQRKAFTAAEKSVLLKPFDQFYTSKEKVEFETHNRFEGRSSYFSYYPTGTEIEQALEKAWFEYQNRKLAEKRRDEETKQIMNEWSRARGRMEAEIQRRKEHLNFATNF